MQFILNEAMHFIALGESFDDVVFMLPDSFGKIARDAYIECSIEMGCQDVDRWLFRHGYLLGLLR